MTGDTPPPTQRTPEELIARLVAGFMAYVSALIDATLLPRACRKHLKATFAALFVRFEAKLIAIVHEQRAANAANQPSPTAQAAKPQERARRQRPKTTPIPNAPPPASAPTAESATAEAPPQKRAPAPNSPTRAPSAVGQSTIFALPNPKISKKPPSPSRIRTPISLRYQNESADPPTTPTASLRGAQRRSNPSRHKRAFPARPACHNQPNLV